MKIGILKEHKSGEKRVAIVPSTVSALSKKGYEFFLVSGSGLLSNYSDNNYKEAGAKIVSQNEVFDCDIICKVNAPSDEEMSLLKPGTLFISLLQTIKEIDCVKKLADKKGLYVGCAPDTFLGAAGQRARKLIEDNKIGKIVLGTFNLMSHGMEHWHPNPDFFFKPGAGPVFDVGVYYITQLVNLIGPVKKINAISGTATNERIITSQPRYGDKIKVETPTTLMGSLEFHNKAKVQFFCTWDVWKNNHSTIAVYYTHLTLPTNREV